MSLGQDAINDIDCKVEKQMTEFDNTNRGVLFKNDRKETDKHPDYTGSLNVDGVEHWFSAWIKTSKNGKKFMSLSLGKPKEAKPIGEVSQDNQDFSDDIPF